ncbi:MAG: hypothetical protein GY720_11275 [bacterium]|nr:hypothetical protein [bacterium]
MGRRARLTALWAILMLLAAACSPAGDSDTTSAAPASSGGVQVTTTSPTADPPEPPPIVPLLRVAGGGGDLVFGQHVPLVSQVLAEQPIARLELWADGTNVDSHEFADPKTDPAVPWEWVASSVGLHALEVRAFDTRGRFAGSSPSWLRVHPGWDPASGIRLGNLPRSPLESASAGVVPDPASCTATVTVPPAPNSLGQTVVGTTLGLGHNLAVAVLGASGGELTVPLTDAPVLLYVGPYDEAMATPQAPAVIPGTSGCSDGSWVGDVTFEGSVLRNDEALEAAYVYASDGGPTWRRLPETGFAPATAGGFDFAGLLPAVSNGRQLEVEAWGWKDGQLVGLGRGRYEAGTVPSSVDPIWGTAQPIAPYSSLNIVRYFTSTTTNDPDEFLWLEDVLCTGAVVHPGCGPRPATVRWDAYLLGAEAALVQVSSGHPPSGPSTDFPGLMWSRMYAMDDATSRAIELDLIGILNGTAPTVDAAGRVAPRPSSEFGYSDLAAMGGELSVVAQPAPLGASPRASTPTVGSWWLDLPPSRLFVRVIPFIDSRPMDGVSNSVLFEIDGTVTQVEPPPAQVLKGLFDVEVRFHHPLVANEKYAHCVRVVENPFGSDNPAPGSKSQDGDDPLGGDLSGPDSSLQFVYDATRDSARVFTENGAVSRGLVPGATVCAYKPDPPDKDIFDYVGEAISFIGEAWDTFKDLVDMVKGGIIQGIVDITGCKPEATCVAALTALADAGLAAVGVPPTMPSFNELMQAAKGDIAAALTDALIGQVCDGPCADFAAQFVEDALDDIEEHFSELATAQAQSGGWVLWLNPDIRVIPEPAGRLFPGSIQATVTRKVDGILVGSQIPEECFAELVTEGSGPISWTEKQGKSHVDEQVTGPVFKANRVRIDLTKLDPGDSVTVGVASLDFDRSHYLKGTGPWLTGSSSQTRVQSLKLWAGFGVNFKMFASVCGQDLGENVPRRSAESPAEIPTP